MVEVNKWNVIFLVDKNPATKIVLLRRSQDKSFAPGFYTGIGGKIGDMPGFENETPLESAYRELSEETEKHLNYTNTQLHEFARCIYDNGHRLYYFWGTYNGDEPPHIDPKDGVLEWVGVDQLLAKDIIPTTKAICEEWQQRGFSRDKPFSVYMRESGRDRTVRLVEVTCVADSLA